jgi:hypothetical protein
MPNGSSRALRLRNPCIFAAPKDVRQDVATAVINHVPTPSGLVFLAHKRPHLVYFGLFRQTDDDYQLTWVEQATVANLSTFVPKFHVSGFSAGELNSWRNAVPQWT